MEKTPKFDYSDIYWKENGKLKLCIVVGTRPEISAWRRSSPNAASISMSSSPIQARTTTTT